MLLPSTKPSDGTNSDAPGRVRELGPALEVRGLCRRYGRSWALAQVDLRLERGEVLLLAGSNGSGKSTMLRVLSGALRPDAGTIKVEGFEGRDEQRLRTALVGHYFNTYEALSALQNVQIFSRLLGRPSDRAALMPLLETVGLAHRADDAVHTFSAGMHKRLALSRLLLQQPAVALLDEPYGQLDPEGFALLDSLIDQMRQRGTAVIVASHLLEHGAALCDRALLLSKGRVQWTGPAAELPAVSKAASASRLAAARGT